ncbi:hypothetical protein [Streptantibioticus ferralitis]|uniref:Uncharacterized protein n=1 Tax=Streptantibioticus ferralitis TaxID=236510 RepID=A0ABT5YRP2_9ACTN|nr:hypothetical protein [Streptantibioticus ferralitis]MDF2254260.1 hypothetical protein [Streptantibioticus ferralitis]
MYYYESEARSRAAELRQAAYQWRQAQEARQGRGGQPQTAPAARTGAVARLRSLIRPRLAA